MASRFHIDGVGVQIAPTGTRTGKKYQYITLIIIDPQAVKNTCNVSIDSEGYRFYKATNGIKRHPDVATLWFPFYTHCTPANVPDDVGLVEMLTPNMDYLRVKTVTIPKITREFEQIYPEMMTGIRFELSTKPSKPKKSDFVPATDRY